jgi:quercetin dioxygenase-like cupin family protein
VREILPYYRWGMAAGVLGAFVVAVFFLVVDLVLGRPLATPTALGASLFLGVPFDLSRPPSPILVAGYTAVHGALFVGLALAVSSVVLGSRHRPPRAASLVLLLTGIFFISLTIFFLAFSLMSSYSLASGPRALLVVSANLLAAVSMALLLTRAFQTRWRPDPNPRRRSERYDASHSEEKGSHMNTNFDGVRGRVERESRLDEEWFHLFPIARFVQALRTEREYVENRRNAVILMKTEHLRVVLEVASRDTKIAEHVIEGPAVVYVLEGSLELVCMDATRVAHAGEMVVIPHDRPRSMRAQTDVSFLWALSIDAQSDES